MQRLLIIILLLSISTPAWAGGGSYLSQSVNLIVLLVIFGFIAIRNVPIMFSNRSQDIQYNIQKGQKELESAKQQNEELKKQLENLSTRIEAIQQQAKEDINAMEAKMSKQIEDEKLRIQDSTTRSIEEELSRAKSELQRESVEIAVDLAADLLKENINDEDHQRLSQNFVSAVAKGGLHG